MKSNKSHIRVSNVNKDIIIYYILIIGSIIAILFGSISYSKFSDQRLFNCKNLIITGCELVSEESIRNQLSYLKYKSVFNINKDDISTKLVNNEFISSINLSIILPNSLFIDIQEVKPISIVSIGDNNFLIDENHYFVTYNSSMTNNIQIPRIYFNNSIEVEAVFNKFEYKFIKEAYLKYPLLYEEIDNIMLEDDIIITSFNENYIYFDSNQYIKQLRYLSEFFNTINMKISQVSYEYIKFAGSNIIVKGKKNFKI